MSWLIAISCSGQHTETSLAGSVACGTTSCGSGQLCVVTPNPSDAGIDQGCSAVAGGCPVFDCHSTEPNVSCPGCTPCPTCIDQMCGYYPQDQNIQLAGRTLDCPSF